MSITGALDFTPFSTVHTRPAFSHTNTRPSGATVTPVGWFQPLAIGVLVRLSGQNAVVAALASDERTSGSATRRAREGRDSMGKPRCAGDGPRRSKSIPLASGA